MIRRFLYTELLSVGTCMGIRTIVTRSSLSVMCIRAMISCGSTMDNSQLSRRTALSILTASSLTLKTALAAKRVPIGLEIYSVREEFKKNEMSTLEAVSAMGYECLEFHGVYAEWTPEHAKQIRSKLDGLNLKCYSTHNSRKAFAGDDLKRAARSQ